MSTRAPTHYQVLEVAHDSTQEDIKSAYYKLTKVYHPTSTKLKKQKLNFKLFQVLMKFYHTILNAKSTTDGY